MTGIPKLGRTRRHSTLGFVKALLLASLLWPTGRLLATPSESTKTATPAESGPATELPLGIPRIDTGASGQEIRRSVSLLLSHLKKLSPRAGIPATQILQLRSETKRLAKSAAELRNPDVLLAASAIDTIVVVPAEQELVRKKEELLLEASKPKTMEQLNAQLETAGDALEGFSKSQPKPKTMEQLNAQLETAGDALEGFSKSLKDKPQGETVANLAQDESQREDEAREVLAREQHGDAIDQLLVLAAKDWSLQPAQGRLIWRWIRLRFEAAPYSLARSRSGQALARLGETARSAAGTDGPRLIASVGELLEGGAAPSDALLFDDDVSSAFKQDERILPIETWSSELRASRAETPSSIRPAHMRKGFFQRYSIGAGYSSNSFSTADDLTHLQVSGTCLAVSLMWGGSLTPGLVLGGGFWLGLGSGDVSVRTGSWANSHEVIGTMLLAAFLDYYPYRFRGLQFFAGAGLATSKLTSSGPATYEGVGFGWTSGIGYEIWISNRWSAGLLAQLNGVAPMSAKGALSPDSKVLLMPALLLDFTGY